MFSVHNASLSEGQYAGTLTQLSTVQTKRFQVGYLYIVPAIKVHYRICAVYPSLPTSDVIKQNESELANTNL